MKWKMNGGLIAIDSIRNHRCRILRTHRPFASGVRNALCVDPTQLNHTHVNVVIFERHCQRLTQEANKRFSGTERRRTPKQWLIRRNRRIQHNMATLSFEHTFECRKYTVKSAHNIDRDHLLKSIKESSSTRMTDAGIRKQQIDRCLVIARTNDLSNFCLVSHVDAVRKHLPIVSIATLHGLLAFYFGALQPLFIATQQKKCAIWISSGKFNGGSFTNARRSTRDQDRGELFGTTR
mmetsp:Transcript_58004/g.96185  ORF Transcript_58004/g.96185 Transcript_58004/m.96185 type:complete len:236 (-) Transcript_58004:173-880(-)